MNNKSKIKTILEFLKHRVLFIVSITLICIFLGYALFRGISILTRKPNQKVPKPQFSSRGEELVTKLEVPLPKERLLPVFRLTQKTPDKKQFWGVARNLGFTDEPQIMEDAKQGRTYIWAENGKTLIAYPKEGAFNFSYDSPGDVVATQGDLPSIEEAQKLVSDLLKNQGLYSTFLSSQFGKARTLKLTTARTVPVTATKADILEISLSGRAAGYPILTNGGLGKDPVVAWLDRNKKIIKLDYYFIGKPKTTIGNYPLKSQKEVETELTKGEASLVKTTALKDEGLENAVVSGAAIAYIKMGTLLEPVYVLEGEAKTKSGEKRAATFYLPAINSKFLEDNQ